MNLPILGDLQAEAENRALKVQSMGNQRGSISWFFLKIDTCCAICIWPPEGTRGLGLRMLRAQGADRESDPGLEFTAEVFQGFTIRVLDLST